MLFGRDRELDALTEALRGERPLALEGEAGIGKTALLRAASARSGRAVFVGGGLATLSWMSYVPVERALGGEVPLGDRAAVAEEVVGRVAGGVMILDELHWADRETLDLIPLLAGRLTLLASLRLDAPGTPAARAALARAGAETIVLGELEAGTAAELVRHRGPDLSPEQVARVVEAARGNAFLLEELAVGAGEISTSVRLSLAARVRARSSQERLALAILGSLGRPSDPALIGETAATALLDAGMAARSGIFIALRHALLGEAAVALLTPAERRDVHARIAPAVSEPGESAVHHFAAGERELSRARALEAADQALRPGERARHLELAARAASATGQDDLRLRAARALIEAGGHASALEILGLVGSGHATAAIARRLGIGPMTVESAIRDAMATLGVRTRVQAAVRAREMA